MRRFRFACVLALLFAVPASAQGAREWIFDDNPEAPSLAFGSPDSDDVISFLCEPGAKRMTIVESVAAPKLNPGGTATFKLTAGTASLDLSGDATANESDGTVSIEVNGTPNPRVFALLKAGPSLTIEVAGARETIPLAPARRCTSRRWRSFAWARNSGSQNPNPLVPGLGLRPPREQAPAETGMSGVCLTPA
jgi:hypothetical protein